MRTRELETPIQQEWYTAWKNGFAHLCKWANMYQIWYLLEGKHGEDRIYLRTWANMVFTTFASDLLSCLLHLCSLVNLSKSIFSSSGSTWKEIQRTRIFYCIYLFKPTISSRILNSGDHDQLKGDKYKITLCGENSYSNIRLTTSGEQTPGASESIYLII